MNLDDPKKLQEETLSHQKHRKTERLYVHEMSTCIGV